MQVQGNTAIEFLLLICIRWQSIRTNTSLLWTRNSGMAEARAAFGLPPMSPGLSLSLSFAGSQTNFAHQVWEVHRTCIHVSRSRMVCRSGGKTSALIVQVLRRTQISIFALRDWADPACFHSQCDKHLCKLDDSHAFCKGLVTPDSL